MLVTVYIKDLSAMSRCSASMAVEAVDVSQAFALARLRMHEIDAVKNFIYSVRPHCWRCRRRGA